MESYIKNTPVNHSIFMEKFHCFTLTKNFKIKRLFMTYYDAFMDYISWTIMHFIGKS